MIIKTKGDGSLQFDYLKDFEKRMKFVGRFGLIIQNTVNKDSWKKYQIESTDEKINMVFSVFMCIMEYSLKEDDCTIDEIADFLEDINHQYFKRELSRGENRELADFIVNKILSNDGAIMSFQGYSYTKEHYERIEISFLSNRVVYQENGVRRVAYKLTEDGYNMMLATMELENNLKVTIHEMLFRLHIEKADYSKAVHDIRNIFDGLRIQNQKIQDTMYKIRKNALSYTVEEYGRIIRENIETVGKSREQFEFYKNHIDEKIAELKEQELHLNEFGEKEQENLDNLKIIMEYLSRAIDEQQNILNSHFDLKVLYDRELQNYADMTMIQRFDFRREIYDRVIDDVSKLENFSEMFGPLFYKGSAKRINMEKFIQYQQKLRKEDLEEEGEELGLNREEFLREQREKIRKKLGQYMRSLQYIVKRAYEQNGISLSDLKADMDSGEEDIAKTLIPTIEVFREIMIELLSEGEIHIEELRKEQKKYMIEQSEHFQLKEMLLKILDENHLKHIKKIVVTPDFHGEKVVFSNVLDENGTLRRLKCANIRIEIQ